MADMFGGPELGHEHRSESTAHTPSSLLHLDSGDIHSVAPAPSNIHCFSCGATNYTYTSSTDSLPFNTLPNRYPNSVHSLTPKTARSLLLLTNAELISPRIRNLSPDRDDGFRYDATHDAQMTRPRSINRPRSVSRGSGSSIVTSGSRRQRARSREPSPASVRSHGSGHHEHPITSSGRRDTSTLHVPPRPHVQQRKSSGSSSNSSSMSSANSGSTRHQQASGINRVMTTISEDRNERDELVRTITRPGTLRALPPTPQMEMMTPPRPSISPVELKKTQKMEKAPKVRRKHWPSMVISSLFCYQPLSQAARRAGGFTQSHAVEEKPRSVKKKKPRSVKKNPGSRAASSTIGKQSAGIGTGYLSSVMG